MSVTQSGLRISRVQSTAQSGTEEKRHGSDTGPQVRAADTTSRCQHFNTSSWQRLCFLGKGHGGPKHAACTATAPGATARQREVRGHAGAKHNKNQADKEVQKTK